MSEEPTREIYVVPNFIELSSVKEANAVDLAKWSFVGLREGKYVFKKRQKNDANRSNLHTLQKKL